MRRESYYIRCCLMCVWASFWNKLREMNQERPRRACSFRIFCVKAPDGNNSRVYSTGTDNFEVEKKKKKGTHHSQLARERRAPLPLLFALVCRRHCLLLVWYRRRDVWKIDNNGSVCVSVWKELTGKLNWLGRQEEVCIQPQLVRTCFELQHTNYRYWV